MSLFKILKGEKSRISTDITPFHDGWAYFTPEDGGFYIDATTNGEQNRIRVDRPSETVNTVLSAESWTKGVQVVTVPGMSVNVNGHVGAQENITKEQMDSICAAQLHVTAHGEGTITVTAFGEIPTVDIPITVTISK